MSAEARPARSALELFKDHPVTMTCCALWVVIFVAMIVRQGGLQGGVNPLANGISPQISHIFGDQTPRDIRAGQLWRTVTSTFIHYSLVHLVFNLVAMYQLGQVIETWYGSRLFLAICVVIGFFGNLFAGLARPLFAGITRTPLQAVLLNHSGGGSSIICGLIALLAVVGWRSRTRFGDFLRAQMVAILVFTAILGIALPNIDNFGHAGGVIVGAIFGFGHRMLVRTESGRAATMIAAGAAFVLILCAGFQVRAGVPESRNLRFQERLLAGKVYEDLLQAEVLYEITALPREARVNVKQVASVIVVFMDQGRTFLVREPAVPIKDAFRLVDENLRQCILRLDLYRALSFWRLDQRSYLRMRQLALRAATSRPSPDEARRFRQDIALLIRQAQQALLASGVRRLQVQRVSQPAAKRGPAQK
jgi:rhomboid protease GluP